MLSNIDYAYKFLQRKAMIEFLCPDGVDSALKVFEGVSLFNKVLYYIINLFKLDLAFNNV